MCRRDKTTIFRRDVFASADIMGHWYSEVRLNSCVVALVVVAASFDYTYGRRVRVPGVWLRVAYTYASRGARSFDDVRRRPAAVPSSPRPPGRIRPWYRCVRDPVCTHVIHTHTCARLSVTTRAYALPGQCQSRGRDFSMEGADNDKTKYKLQVN